MFSMEKNHIKEQNALIQLMRKEFLNNKEEIARLRDKLQKNQSPVLKKDTNASEIEETTLNTIDLDSQDGQLSSRRVDQIFKGNQEDLSLATIDIPSIYEAYIPKTILSNLTELNPDDYFRGKRKYVTLLQMKVNEINYLSKQVSPEAYVKLYNKLFNQTFASVYKHDGIINQYVGESFLAVFGLFDENRDESAEKSIKCAQELTQKINSINEYLEEKNLTSIHISIGVHSGDVIVGEIGAIGRKEIYIMGDDVKIAESVSHLSKEHHFAPIISENTKEHLTENLHLQEVNELILPVIEESIKLFQL